MSDNPTHPSQRKRPILVTGAERTGTSWVGHMLTASKEAAYISESFNFFVPRIWMDGRIKFWCQYICPENEQEFIPPIQNVLNFQYPYWKAAGKLRSMKDLHREVFDTYAFSTGKLFRKRALFKDPSAIFSAPWLSSRFRAQVVITVRNPYAFVSSRKYLNWPIRLEDWLAQPLLMRDLLDPFRGEIERSIRDEVGGKPDLIGRAITYWRVCMQVIANYKRTHPHFIVVRHEDLSTHSVECLHNIYKALGLSFNGSVMKEVEMSTKPGTDIKTSKENPYVTQLDSIANLESWKNRLTAKETHRIEKATEDVSPIFY